MELSKQKRWYNRKLNRKGWVENPNWYQHDWNHYSNTNRSCPYLQDLMWQEKGKEDTTAIYVCIYIYIPRREKISTQSAKVQLFLGPFKHHLYSSGRETTHEMEICWCCLLRESASWLLSDGLPSSRGSERDISFLTWIWQTHRDTYYYELIHDVSVKETLNWKKPKLISLLKCAGNKQIVISPTGDGQCNDK